MLALKGWFTGWWGVPTHWNWWGYPRRARSRSSRTITTEIYLYFFPKSASTELYYYFFSIRWWSSKPFFWYIWISLSLSIYIYICVCISILYTQVVCFFPLRTIKRTKSPSTCFRVSKVPPAKWSTCLWPGRDGYRQNMSNWQKL